LIAASFVVSAASGDIQVLSACLAPAATYGAVMIAISFVQPAARASVVAETIASHIERTERASQSWQAHLVAHAAGATLNLSGLLIIQSAIHRAALTSADKMATAVTFLRGFATAPVWSPYSYYVPIVLAAFPAVTWRQLGMTGLLIAGPFLLLSLRAPPLLDIAIGMTAPEGNVDSRRPPNAALSRWLVFATFFSSVLALLTFGTWNSLAMVIVVLPPLAVAWGALEGALGGNSRGFAEAIKIHVVRQVPLLRSEILALAAAGMASHALAPWFQKSSLLLPSLATTTLVVDVAQAVSILLLIVLATMLGINPILFVSPLASLAGNTEAGSLSTTVALVILCCAWALFPTVSPFAAATLVTGRETGSAPRDLVMRVNGRYNMRALIYSTLLVASTAVAVRFGHI
jgi:hypothetical protein